MEEGNTKSRSLSHLQGVFKIRFVIIYICCSNIGQWEKICRFLAAKLIGLIWSGWIMKRAADSLNITCDQAEERNRLACDGTKEGRGGRRGELKKNTIRFSLA